MSYIGRQNLGGAYRQLDDISSGFDGSDTTHTMQVNSQNVTVGDVNQIILSLGGVIQKPGTDFTVSGSTLTFTTAPAANTSFFAILLGSDNGGTVTPTDGSVTGDKIASDLSIATNVTITTADNTDTLTLTSTDADANAGPNLRLYRNSSSPAVSDVIGVIEIEGRNDNSEDIVYQQYQHLIADETDGTEDGYFIFNQMKAGTLTERYRIETGTFVINDPGADFDFRVESDNDTHALFVDASQDHVGIGTNNPIGKLFVSGNNVNFATYIANDGNNDNRYGLSIKCGNDDASGTNYAVAIYDGDGTSQGFITFSSGTVTYGAFTAHHPCIIPDADNDPSSADNAYPYGTLLETTSISYTQKDGANTERGILYNVQKTSSAYSRKVLGAYGSCMNGGPTNQTNEHQALVLGDGHILCNNEKGNISAGDGICSSSTAGIGMKADKMAMIVGIAQEDVTFSGSETKLVAVQYGVRQFTPWTD